MRNPIKNARKPLTMPSVILSRTSIVSMTACGMRYAERPEYSENLEKLKIQRQDINKPSLLNEMITRSLIKKFVFSQSSISQLCSPITYSTKLILFSFALTSIATHCMLIDTSRNYQHGMYAITVANDSNTSEET